MIDTKGKHQIVIVGYKNATLTNEFFWWLSAEFTGSITIIEPSQLELCDNSAFIVSVNKDEVERLSVIEQIKHSAFVTFVHSTAVLHNECQILPGTFVGPHAGIYYNASVGNHCIIAPNTVISHNTKIGSNNIIQPGTIIAGSCSIGNNCVFGLRSTVVDKIKICNNVNIGAGAMVTKNIVESGYYLGSPARKKL